MVTSIIYAVVIKLHEALNNTNNNIKLPSCFTLHLEALQQLNNQILIGAYPEVISVYLDLILDNIITGSYPAVEYIIQELTIYLEVEARDSNNTAYLKACFNNMIEVVKKLIPSLIGGI